MSQTFHHPLGQTREFQTLTLRTNDKVLPAPAIGAIQKYKIYFHNWSYKSKYFESIMLDCNSFLLKFAFVNYSEYKSTNLLYFTTSENVLMKHRKPIFGKDNFNRCYHKISCHFVCYHVSISLLKQYTIAFRRSI